MFDVHDVDTHKSFVSAIGVCVSCLTDKMIFVYQRVGELTMNAGVQLQLQRHTMVTLTDGASRSVYVKRQRSVGCID